MEEATLKKFRELRFSRIKVRELRSSRFLGFTVPVLPSHASHVLQPLDLAVFGVFKATISKGDSNLRKLTLPERRSAMMVKAIKSLYLALSPDIILISSLFSFPVSIHMIRQYPSNTHAFFYNMMKHPL